jgi:hypothetical protein
VEAARHSTRTLSSPKGDASAEILWRQVTAKVDARRGAGEALDRYERKGNLVSARKARERLDALGGSI